MTDGLELWDICAQKHGGSPESQDANRRTARHRSVQQARVREAIRAAGPDGMTCKELAEQWGVGMNRISGRFSELKRDGRIIRARDIRGNPIRRDGSGAYVPYPHSP